MPICSVDDLPAPLKAAVPAFADRYSGYAEPAIAAGNCHCATDTFRKDAALARYPHSTIEFAFERVRDTRNTWKKSEGPPVPVEIAYLYLKHCNDQDSAVRRYEGHTVAKVGRWYIDFTARQFDPDAPFPLIWTLRARKEQECLTRP